MMTPLRLSHAHKESAGIRHQAFDEVDQCLHRRGGSQNNGCRGQQSSFPSASSQDLKFEDVEYWGINEAFPGAVARCVMLKEEYGLELDLQKSITTALCIALLPPGGLHRMSLIVTVCTMRWNAQI